MVGGLDVGGGGEGGVGAEGGGGDVEGGGALVAGDEEGVVGDGGEVVAAFEGQGPAAEESEGWVGGVPVLEGVFAELVVPEGVEALELWVPDGAVGGVEGVGVEDCVGLVEAVDGEAVALGVGREGDGDASAGEEVGRMGVGGVGGVEGEAGGDVDQKDAA